MRKVLFSALLFVSVLCNGQVFLDSCFTGAPIGTSFGLSPNLVGLDTDLIEWTGSNWIGAWPNANITVPPPIDIPGVRSIFLGSATAWTTGGEGVAMHLSEPLIQGETYSFTFTTISHGMGSNGAFAPSFRTNTTWELFQAVTVGSLQAVGNTWTTNDFIFTASPQQNGHDWLILHTGPAGSSGMLLASLGCYGSICSVDLGDDIILCPDSTLVLNAEQAGVTYEWQDGSTASAFEVTTAGTYWVTITSDECTASDTVVVVSVELPETPLGNDTTLCVGPLILDATLPSATYTWNDGSTGPTISVIESGTYWVEITIQGCPLNDTMDVFILEQDLDLGPDLTLCPGEEIILDPGAIQGDHLWHDGSTEEEFLVNEAGSYWLTVSLDGCEASDTVSVTFTALPHGPLDDELVLCEGTTTVIDATLPGATYLWNTGWASPSIIVNSAGVYWVELTVSGCTFIDSIHVLAHPPPSISLGEDQVICEGSFLQLLAAPATAPFSYLWQDGSTSNSYTTTASEEIWVIASLGTCTSSDTLVIEFEDCTLIVEMPNVFSPNNDGHNDRFIPIHMQGTGAIALSIFDRWGKEVHTTSNLMWGWDGKRNGLEAPDGMYYWILSYSDGTGSTLSKHGSLTLLR